MRVRDEKGYKYTVQLARYDPRPLYVPSLAVIVISSSDMTSRKSRIKLLVAVARGE